MKSFAGSKNRVIAVALVVLSVAGALSWFRVGPPPQISIEPEMPGIGRRTPIAVRATEPQRGLSNISVELVQGQQVFPLAQRSHQPRPFWSFWGPRVANDDLVIEVGSETLEGLQEGEARLRVKADLAPTWLRHPAPVVEEIILPVRLTPPSVQVTSTQTYVAQGGSEAVVYTVGPSSIRDGVRVADYWFPGYPLPGGGAEERFALFGVPHDLEDASLIQLTSVDDVGNERAIRFVDKFLAKPLRTDTIKLSDSFMERVVPAILAQSPQAHDQGDLLATYLTINRDLRGLNTQSLLEMAARSAPRFLWNQSFLQLPNTQSMASFADRRTYLYEGREVDQQDHLGFDLASVRRAPVLAANRGVVLLAEYFGIYGNTVVLDHGHGLMTLYAHLSSFEVELGQEVARGDSLGRTGQTGLAGGDHLHFSILLHGLQVNPLEWWDPKWIENRIARKLGPALELEN